jgi:hypothetical protein
VSDAEIDEALGILALALADAGAGAGAGPVVSP